MPENICNRINKSYINYEAAKDLKRLGYNQPCDKFFIHMYDDNLTTCDSSKRFSNVTYKELEDGDILCPRLEDVKIWLLEKYNIYVSVEPFSGVFSYFVYNMKEFDSETGEHKIILYSSSEDEKHYNDYIDAEIDGINNIINYICENL